jgi:hypothetical protein
MIGSILPEKQEIKWLCNTAMPRYVSGISIKQQVSQMLEQNRDGVQCGCSR